MIAISRLVASWPPYSSGQRPPQPARGVGPAAHLAQQVLPLLAGTPPSSKSVRAHSRRWSKKRMLSSSASSGLDLALDERRRARRASPGCRAGCRSPRNHHCESSPGAPDGWQTAPASQDMIDIEHGPLVDRDDELDERPCSPSRALSGERSRPGGVGKTRLALAVVTAVATERPGAAVVDRAGGGGSHRRRRCSSQCGRRHNGRGP